MSMPRSILVIHGPTLSKLGTREPKIYGTQTLEQINAVIAESGTTLHATITARQSNHEGVIIDWLLEAAAEEFHGVVLNAGGYSHTSVAIRDAITACGLPVVEVHLSQVHAREAFRQTLITASACVGVITGFGTNSYVLGLRALIEYLNTRISA